MNASKIKTGVAKVVAPAAIAAVLAGGGVVAVATSANAATVAGKVGWGEIIKTAGASNPTEYVGSLGASPKDAKAMGLSASTPFWCVDWHTGNNYDVNATSKTSLSSADAATANYIIQYYASKGAAQKDNFSRVAIAVHQLLDAGKTKNAKGYWGYEVAHATGTMKTRIASADRWIKTAKDRRGPYKLSPAVTMNAAHTQVSLTNTYVKSATGANLATFAGEKIKVTGTVTGNATFSNGKKTMTFDAGAKQTLKVTGLGKVSVSLKTGKVLPAASLKKLAYASGKSQNKVTTGGKMAASGAASLTVTPLPKAPSVASTATDKADGDHLIDANGGTVNEHVTGVAPLPSKSYTIKSELKSVSGKKVLSTASKAVKSGTDYKFATDVSLAVPKGYAGQDLSVHTQLLEGSKVLVDHNSGLNTKSQTLTVANTPGLGTTAQTLVDGKSDGDHQLDYVYGDPAYGQATWHAPEDVPDSQQFGRVEGLIQDRFDTTKATAVDPEAGQYLDASDPARLVNADGNLIDESGELVDAEGAPTQTPVAGDLTGLTSKAFTGEVVDAEKGIYKDLDGKLVNAEGYLVHEDGSLILEQTQGYFERTGTSTVTAQTNDVVKYSKMDQYVGASGTLKTTIMDKATGKDVTKAVTGAASQDSTQKVAAKSGTWTTPTIVFDLGQRQLTQVFVPEDQSGATAPTDADWTSKAASTDVDDSKVVKKTSYVFFEDYVVGGKTIASHHDIKSAAQSVAAANPVMGTTAADKADGDKVISYDGGTITDTVTASGLSLADLLKDGATFRLDASIYDQTSEQERTGVHASKVVKPEESKKNTWEIDLDVPADFAGKKVTVYERLVAVHKDGTETVVVSHTNPNSKEQTVTVSPRPTGHTLALDKADGNKYLTQFGGDVIDTLTYTEGANANEEYTVVLDGIKASSGEELGTPVHVEQAVKLNPKGGTVEIPVTVPGIKDLGTDAVAFNEKLVDSKGKTVFENLNKDNPAETVYLPSIGTIAMDKADGDHAFGPEGGTLIDEVDMSNHAAGTYYLTGQLMKKDAKGEVTPVKGAVGDAVTTVAEDGTSTTGKVEIEVPENEGTDEVHYVVYEQEFSDKDHKHLVASHEDKDSADQAVVVNTPTFTPSIGTTATDVKDGDHEFGPDGGTLNDQVASKDHRAGTYYLTGQLMKKVGEKCEVVEGATGSGSYEVAKNHADATGNVEIKVPANEGAEDVTYVVFEKEFSDKEHTKLVATHEDCNDQAQTVVVKGTKPVTPQTPEAHHTPATPAPVPSAPLAHTGLDSGVLTLGGIGAAILAAGGALIGLNRKRRLAQQAAADAEPGIEE